MNRIKRQYKTWGVICPNCKVGVSLAWYPTCGIYRGYCWRCGYLIYSRHEFGSVWSTWINPDRCRRK